MTEANTLDGLIVEHIGDLEAARRRIEEEIDPRLLREASAMMQHRAYELGWVHEFLTDDVGQISVAPEEWVNRSESGAIDSWRFWLELSQIKSGGGINPTWHLTEFLDIEGGALRKGLSFYQEGISKKDWRMILNKSVTEVRALRDLGFDVDQRDGTIEMPVRLDPSAIKKGFEEDDLSDAMAPVIAALNCAVKAMPQFQALASLALTVSKM